MDLKNSCFTCRYYYRLFAPENISQNRCIHPDDITAWHEYVGLSLPEGKMCSRWSQRGIKEQRTAVVQPFVR